MAKCTHEAAEGHMGLPEKTTDVSKMSGHWLLAKMGKRVLRPGGLELTRQMLSHLKVSTDDSVVEFAPGLGITAQMVMKKNPASYVAIEREEAAADKVRGYLQSGRNYQCRVGLAEDTGLPSESATVVYGEAMLSMQTDEKKRQIIREAARILKPGGRYGIHELCVASDDIDSALQKEIHTDLSSAIRVNANPATVNYWKKIVEEEGFEVEQVVTVPFHLLEPKRLIQDEGLAGAVRFAVNLLRYQEERQRILNMRKVFRKYRSYLNGIAIVAVKRADTAALKELTEDDKEEVVMPNKFIDLSDFTKFSSEKPYNALVHDSPYCKIITFCLEPGQELPVHKHSADSQFAIVALEGEGIFTGGEDDVSAKAGQLCIGMVSTPHGVRAITRMRMLVIIAPTI